MSDNPHVLIVDDEEDLCTLMQLTLQKMGMTSKTAYHVAAAKAELAASTFDLCLTDLNLPDGSGLEIVSHIAEYYTDTPVAVITAYGNMDLAIEALKLGAFDFVNKPLELPRLRQLIQNAIKLGEKNSQHAVNKQLDNDTRALIGESAVIQRLRKTIRKLARSQAPVFLHGESGTGKEVVAKLIHELSPRSEGNFVPVNCGAIPSELMESEFFGHKKGSFTGAMNDKLGLFQQADGGTLFLDEVADLPLAMQVKLLRAIQEKKVRPVGSQQEVAVDIRLLSATHKNLTDLVAHGAFRQDLFYRINVIELKLPSLNERGDDIMLLAAHFVQQISEEWQDDEPPQLSNAAKQALEKHHFHGNVRELRNILERAMTLCDGDQIEPEHLQLPNNQNLHYSNQAIDFSGQLPALNLHDAQSFSNLTPISEHQLKAIMEDASGTVGLSDLPSDGLEGYLVAEEKRLMLEALEATKWNRTKAAEKLGMSFRSFRYRMKKLGIADDD